MEDLAATLFDLSAILHQARDRDVFRRWAPRVVLEEIDEACLELAELEDDLLPIRALVMAAYEAAEDEPASPPKPDSLKGDPTMPDETRDRDEAQPRQTADLRPERLGHTAELRPERLGQTGELRPERLGEPLSVAQVEERMGKLGEDWKVEGDRERLTLRRSFPFVPAAALFVLKVTLEIGVFEGFMPDVRMDNLEVEVGVSSSAHGRLTDHDFELARKLDSL